MGNSNLDLDTGWKDFIIRFSDSFGLFIGKQRCQQPWGWLFRSWLVPQLWLVAQLLVIAWSRTSSVELGSSRPFCQLFDRSFGLLSFHICVRCSSLGTLAWSSAFRNPCSCTGRGVGCPVGLERFRCLGSRPVGCTFVELGLVGFEKRTLKTVVVHWIELGWFEIEGPLGLVEGICLGWILRRRRFQQSLWFRWGMVVGCLEDWIGMGWLMEQISGCCYNLSCWSTTYCCSYGYICPYGLIFAFLALVEVWLLLEGLVVDQSELFSLLQYGRKSSHHRMGISHLSTCTGMVESWNWSELHQEQSFQSFLEVDHLVILTRHFRERIDRTFLMDIFDFP